MINTGPFMLYFGQEIGECATDNEGFAGDNNRTTIFDYWSYSSLRRWCDGGRWGTAALTQQEAWLRALYARVLHLCNSEKAVSQGRFFDLMYVNLHNPDLNPHHIFSFMRQYGDDVLLYTCSDFSPKYKPIDISVDISNVEFLKICFLNADYPNEGSRHPILGIGNPTISYQ